ncbi:protein of unknown function [Flavobacterium flevense]|nr:DUF1896 domain-containing protein [Flavobacterium flevense]SHM21254.1 protein of unknown function [Flavobacterium flevense]
MDMLPKKLSYFSLRLQELLNTSFPEKAWDTKFIEDRSQRAAHIYEEAFKAGNSIAQCDEIANYTLFEGLDFSKFDTVFKVVINEFDSIMGDEELRSFALKIRTICESVFQRYKLSQEFVDSTDYELLYTELTGTIAIWIEENGLQ